MLKGIAAHYVMQAEDRIDLMERQRELIAELVTALLDRGGSALEPAVADDWRDAADDAARLRVVVDQVASLTDISAVSWHARLCGEGPVRGRERPAGLAARSTRPSCLGEARPTACATRWSTRPSTSPTTVSEVEVYVAPYVWDVGAVRC